MDTEKLTTIDLDLDDETMLVANIIMNEGRRREREEIIADIIKEMYSVACCCDTSSFGDHYLSEKQPDNIINLINRRKIG